MNQNRPSARLSPRGKLFLLVLLGVILAEIILLGYRLPWTGFGGFAAPGGAYERYKTVWDWLDLLLVPLALALAGYLFDKAERESAQLIADARKEVEQIIASKRECETAMQNYLDKMSELILTQGLLQSQPGSPVRALAQVRTLALCEVLDSNALDENRDRKGHLVEFLCQAGLVGRESPILSLKGAKLRNASLDGKSLAGATLAGANLQGATLVGADLRKADLSTAMLGNANLYQADLTGAVLSKANLNQAEVTKEQLEQTASTEGMIWP